MTRTIRILLFAVLVLASGAVYAQANTIFNNGFESGNPCAWSTMTNNTCIPVGSIAVALYDTTAVSPVGGNEAQANYGLDLYISAYGIDAWIEKSTQRDSTPDGSDGMEFVVRDGSNNIYTGGLTASTLTADGSISGDTTWFYKIPAGSSRMFHLLVTLDNTVSGTPGYYAVQLSGVSYDLNGTGTTADGGIIVIDQGFNTDWVYVSNVDVAN